MIEFLKKLFGMKPGADFAQLVRDGAQIVDVRTRGEYQSGHIRQSVNIPLNELGGQAGKIRRDKPVITCCASGMRSAAARRMLKAGGFTDVYNGGGWLSLQNKIR